MSNLTLRDYGHRGYVERFGQTYCEGCIHYLGEDDDCPKTDAIIIVGCVNGKCNLYQREKLKLEQDK